MEYSKKKRNPFNHIEDALGLLKVFVFDVWIINIDRNNRNIILYKSKENSLRYNYYLIDHGLSLFGAFTWKHQSWKSDYWNHVYKYNRRYLKGLPGFIVNNLEKLNYCITELQGLPDSRIEEIIQQLPSDILIPRNRRIIKNFLIKRKANLNTIIENWLEDYENNHSKLT